MWSMNTKQDTHTMDQSGRADQFLTLQKKNEENFQCLIFESFNAMREQKGRLIDSMEKSGKKAIKKHKKSSINISGD